MNERCPECGSVDIVRDITMSQTVKAGLAGLQYTTGLVLSATEPLLSDLCRNCGTVVRLHVKNPDRKWQTKS